MAPATGQVTIREFVPGDELAFRQLNEEWINRHFRIEPKDAEIINHPRENILAPGGRIFLAAIEDRCVGCCALIPTGPDEFEVAKMAVTAVCQGLGIGRRLLGAAIDAARAGGARRLHLETNHVLTPAIRLYESMGFRHVPAGVDGPSAYVRADVFMELLLRA